MPTDELSLAEEKDFIEEDPRSKVIKNELDGDEELDAAMDLLKEKYDVPVEDTTSGKPEPKKPVEQGEDTSEKPEDKTKIEQKPKGSDQEQKKPDETAKLKEPVKPEDIPPAFVLTNELIQKQSEEYRDILKKYEGKGKTDLAKAAANAVALKSQYLKDNEKAIGALVEKFETLSNDDIVKTLIETQALVGVAVEPPGKTKPEPLKEEKIELPTLPEDGKVKEVLNKEVNKRLKKIYPEMPEDIDSEEYKEWERDLQDAGLRKVEKFLSDVKSVETSVKKELQKVIYAETNLPNLYNESPDEILPILTDENLPKLKRLNDDFRSVNNESLTEEVGLIKKELVKYGLTETDLGVNLTLEKDENGSYYNEGLNSLMLNGNIADSTIVGQMGKIPFLRKGQLTKKFIFENNAKILTCLAKKNTEQSKVEVDKLKTETLNTLGASKAAGLKTITNPEDIKKITDDDKLDKILDEIKSKY